ncbi:MAG: NAD(P)-dependent oxidoreductase [Acetobacteraceae bacterium]|nr:NAD(P)-dependent oxidoreductase [Acetobacteraceae bacterium]
MKIAVIAPGMMGAAVAQRLHACRAMVAVTLEGRSAESAARATGLMQFPTVAALVSWADVVLSILPPGDALALARRVAPVLVPPGSAVIFADCNAVSPATVAGVAGALPGVGFVDVGIIGGPPRGYDAGPRLYSSGEAAPRLDELCQRGIDLRIIPGGIGAASALKMGYAGITKGITALDAAMALGATEAGAADALRTELAASQPEVFRYLQRSVFDMFPKAYRWVAEMEEISTFLGESPAAPIYGGAARLYAEIAADQSVPRQAGEVAQLRHFYRKD